MKWNYIKDGVFPKDCELLAMLDKVFDSAEDQEEESWKDQVVRCRSDIAQSVRDEFNSSL